MQLRANGLLALLVAATVGLAGCSSGGGKSHQHDDVACPDGLVLTGDDVAALPNHDDAGFNATSSCPEPPYVSLTGIPVTLGAYTPTNFTWGVHNGSIAKGHSMLSTLRWSPTPIAAGDLTEMTVYPNELLKREHQELPVQFGGTLSFNQPGKVYLRAYSQIQGEEYSRREFWSPEIALEILPVAPTGNVSTITYAAAGDLLDDVSPATLSIALGDAVQLNNQDLQAHECITASVGNPGTISAGSRTTGTPVVFVQPGTFEYSCSGVQDRPVVIKVAAPA